MRMLLLLLLAVVGFGVETPDLGTGTPATPTSLPPSGAAGGALSGTYPNPTQVDQFCWMVEAPSAKTYTIILSSEVAYTVNEVICQTTSGTCTCAFKIGGTNITGLSAVAVTSTPATTTATAANTIALTNTLTVVVSAPVAAVDLVFTIKVTR